MFASRSMPPWRSIVAVLFALVCLASAVPGYALPRSAPADSHRVGRGSSAERAPAPRAHMTTATCPVTGSGWTSIAGVHARVWYQASQPGDGALAAQFSAQIDHHIWRTFLGVMGREPLPVTGAHCHHVDDGKLDVYLAAPTVAPALAGGRSAAVTISYPGVSTCSAYPAFVVIDRSRASATFGTLAHEVFHAFQAAFPKQSGCETLWLDESSAEWSEYLVYPHFPNPARTRTKFLTSEFLTPLNRYRSLLQDASPFQYETWVWELFVQKTFGAGSIGAIYAHLAHAASLKAINSVVNFQANWPRFAIKAWSQTPVTGSFRAWGVSAKPHLPFDKVSLHGLGHSTQPLDWPTLDYLTRDYDPIAVVDPKIRQLTFNNWFAGIDHVGVRALVEFPHG